jgi:hypothetical protein
MKTQIVAAFVMASLASVSVSPEARASEMVDCSSISNNPLVCDSIQEVYDTMEFFQSWWQGEVEKAPENYRLNEDSLLAANFSFVTPDGMNLDRATSLAGLYAQHGARKDLVKIEDLNFKVVLANRNIAILSYDEHQTVRDAATGNLVTVVLVTTSVFERNYRAPNGVTWVRVQETVRQ